MTMATMIEPDPSVKLPFLAKNSLKFSQNANANRITKSMQILAVG